MKDGGGIMALLPVPWACNSAGGAGGLAAPPARLVDSPPLIGSRVIAPNARHPRIITAWLMKVATTDGPPRVLFRQLASRADTGEQ